MADDHTLLWSKVLSQLQTQVSHANFVTLFKNTSLLSLDDNIATIAAPNTMIIDLLQKRFLTQIKESLDQETKADTAIVFVQRVARDHPTHELDEKAGPLFVSEQKPVTMPVGHLPRVRADYTFANFAVSSSNQLGFTAASTVAKNLGTSYNPLFIYGPVGVGKTHLMHAIANDVYQKNPEKKIIYITSEEFTNEVIEAIRTNDTARMKKRFRSAYLMLIDDIQFIEGKEVVQEELFHTFNFLIDNGSQIALSSDRPPHEIKRIQQRLSSRFAGGLTVDVQTPDFELKTAILQKKAEKYGHELPIDVAKLLANNAGDTRTLEGLLLRVITQATTMNQPITLEAAQNALGGVIEEKRAGLHVEDIINNVCMFYQIKSTQLKGPKRDAALVRARQVAMFLLKGELGLTYVEIGNVLGGRDHTTIMHGVEKIGSLVEKKAKITEDIAGITKTLHG